MPQKIQLAIQGGGARLVDLVAALEAVQDLCQAGDLKVTRIAGTSAGGIAGAFFAAGVSMHDLRLRLQALRSADLAETFPRPPGLFRLLWRIRNGNPLWSFEPVARKLKEFLPSGVQSFADLKAKTGIELCVVAADLSTALPIPYRGEQRISDGVAASCGIPVAFRHYGSFGSSAEVDGGICENLPVAFLDASAIDEPIVCISFASDAAGPIQRSTTWFLMALVNTVISNSIARAKSSLPEGQVFEIETDIRTFDFDQALAACQDHNQHYKEVKKSARTFFDHFIAQQRRLSITSVANRWNTSDAGYLETMRHLGEVFGVRLDHTPLQYERCSLEVFANCLFEPGEPHHSEADELRFVQKFRVLNSPAGCHRIGLHDLQKATFRTVERIVVVGPDNVGVRFRAVPALPSDGSKTRQLLLLFEEDLPANSGPYTVSYRQLISNYAWRLAEEKNDEFWFGLSRSAGPIPEIDIVVHLPVRLDTVILSPYARSPGGEMRPNDKMPYEVGGEYKTVGWRGANVSPGQKFGCAVSLV
jgi:predicted acylesterase/phospholipase RssA